MPSTETLLSEALAKWAPVANSGVEANKQGWLTVSWCHETSRVQYGCEVCERALAQGKIRMPHRYRDKTKGHCFAHGNIYDDLRRAVNRQSHLMVGYLLWMRIRAMKSVVMFW